MKQLREEDEESITDIADTLGISWRTAKKYADGDLNTEDRPKQKRIRPVMGPYTEVVDAWLAEDMLAPRKQRRTAKAIYQQLKERTDYSGSARTIRRYVSKRRQELIDAAKTQYVKLTHEPGTAQVDFGEFKGVHPETRKLHTYPYLVVTFPHSNAQLARVTPAENIECFLEALKDIFNELGGVPKVLWFDNLSSAVTDVLKGTKRKLTKAFTAFKWHYRFGANFCNVGEGHEKGHVEGKVGYVRRNWMSPPPLISDVAEFNDNLKAEMAADRDRDHYEKDELISQLFKYDLDSLLKLPTEEFEVVRTDTKVANKYGEIKVGDETYHVGSAHPKQNLFLKIYWNKIVVYDEYGEKKLTTLPRKYVPKRVDDIDWIEELKIFKTKPRAIEQAAYLQALPAATKEYLLPEDLTARRERIKVLINLLKDYEMSEIDKAIKTAAEENKLEKEYLKAILAYGNQEAKPATNPGPTLTIYDRLRPEGVSYHE
ncbi:IS21 family transposase [Candidatus Bipolaricaulota bacterium]|nr:IS21 family transposase [Candidatus Bipolaricaulota bacterium]